MNTRKKGEEISIKREYDFFKDKIEKLHAQFSSQIKK